MKENEFVELTPDEKKIVDLRNNTEFKKEISEIQNNINVTGKEDRINKIKSILAQKGIDYTDEDAELFNKLIEYATENKIKLGNTELSDISGGKKTDQSKKDGAYTPGPTIEELTESATIYDLPGKAGRRQKIFTWLILFGLTAGSGLIGGAIGYHLGKKKANSY